jgi:hypothetical protein
MSLDPIQLDYRRLRTREQRREEVGLLIFSIVAIGMAVLAGLGLAAFLYYVNHP